jgi:SAM-dependent methyltransferase
VTRSSLANPYTRPDVWSGDAAQRWLDHEPALEQALAPFGNAAITRAGPNPGERILDVGCGTGGTTVALADAVGPRGHVLGVDISAPLLLRARERAAGRRRIQFLQADAQTAAFAPDRDLVFSRFGTMFFSDPAAAFRNLASALKPGGCFTFVCWRQFHDNPWQQLAFDVLCEVMPGVASPTTAGPGPYSLADDLVVRQLMSAAGLTDITFQRIDRQVRLGSELATAVDFAMNTGPTGRALEAADPRTRAQVANHLSVALARWLGADGVQLKASAWLVNAAQRNVVQAA